MKTMFASTLVALAVSSVSAQDFNQTGPFALKIANATNSSLNGLYLYACHAGAAIEGLCLTSASPAASVSEQFYFNYTEYSPTGPLIWNLPINLEGVQTNVSEAMALSYNPTSNVAVPLFGPSSYVDVPYVGFSDDDGSLFIGGYYYDDSTFQVGAYPNVTAPEQLSNWHVCWAIVGGYYYQALTWVTTLPPHNPTCEAVQVIKEDL